MMAKNFGLMQNKIRPAGAGRTVYFITTFYLLEPDLTADFAAGESRRMDIYIK